MVLGVLALGASAAPPATAPTQPATTAADPTATSPATQPEKPAPVAVIRAHTPPVLDGKLDDPVWQTAAVIEHFTQVDPVEGAAPSERTEVRLLYDADALYIGVRCFDSEPKRIIGKQMARDSGFGSDDCIYWSIDTFHDHRNGYAFETGPTGARRDGTIEQGGRVRWEWDGIWLVRTSIDELGWVAEIEIPTKTLAFDAASDTWGFNVARTIRRRQELVRWAGAQQHLSTRSVGQAGELTGIEGLRQGRGLTLKPTLATNVDLRDGSDEWRPGFDAYQRLTPSVTAALTINTDFAETEVDERVVNLTRFPLFFPEKREFFLQDAGIFSFGGIGSDPLPFHSRTIGIVDGEPKDILAGLKLTGRQGASSIGLLNVQMADDPDLGSRNFTVARPALNVLGESTIGGIFTYGDPDGPSNDNALVGTDFNFRTTHYAGDKVVEAHAWVMGTEPPDAVADSDAAAGVSASFPNDPMNWWASAVHIGEEFDPGLGFVSRTGVRAYDLGTGYAWHSAAYIRSVNASVGGSLLTDLDSKPLEAGGGIPSIDIGTRDGDGANFSVEPQWEDLDEPFEIHPGIIVPPDEYTGGEVEMGIWTADSRPLSTWLQFEPGLFYTGTRRDYSTGITWRPTPRFRGSIEYELNDIDLDEGSFDVHVAKGRANVYFSPALSWSNLVQWDSDSDAVGINSRVRWEMEPGRDVYVVLNHGLDLSGDAIHTTESVVTLKAGLTYRF